MRCPLKRHQNLPQHDQFNARCWRYHHHRHQLKIGTYGMVWYGYLFRSDIHFTHVVNILHLHVTQHWVFSIKFIIEVFAKLWFRWHACNSFKISPTPSAKSEDCGCVGVEGENETGITWPWQTVTMSSSKYRQHVYYQNMDLLYNFCCLHPLNLAIPPKPPI
jgi:hypothetical protein